MTVKERTEKFVGKNRKLTDTEKKRLESVKEIDKIRRINGEINIELLEDIEES